MGDHVRQWQVGGAYLVDDLPAREQPRAKSATRDGGDADQHDSPIEHTVPAQSPVVERQPGEDAEDSEHVVRVEREGADLGEDGGHVSGAQDRAGRPPNRHGPMIAIITIGLSPTRSRSSVSVTRMGGDGARSHPTWSPAAELGEPRALPMANPAHPDGRSSTCGDHAQSETAGESGLGPRIGQPITRRTFLAGAAGAGATVMASGLAGVGSSLVRGAPPVAGGDESAPWFEKSFLELQSLMSSGQLTSRELTKAYLDRIARLNPTLGAVIETNPQAVGHRGGARR